MPAKKKKPAKKTLKKKVGKKIVKKTPKKKVVKGVPKKVVRKKLVKKVTKKETSKTKRSKKQEQEDKILKIIEKGKERHYITHDEILNIFPDAENDLVLLDELYDKLENSGVKIIESGKRRV